MATFHVIADTTGLVGRTDGDFWERVWLLCVRANAVGWLLAALAFAIATVGRHTAAALGGLIGYVVVWEIGARVVAESVGSAAGTDQSLFLITHLYVWLDYPYSRQAIDGMAWGDSAAVLILLGLGSVAATFAWFRRRDLV